MYKILKDVFNEKIRAIEILGGKVRQAYTKVNDKFFVALELYKVVNNKEIIVDSYIREVNKDSYIESLNTTLNETEIKKQEIIAELAKIATLDT